jgi:hypothetical protein
LAELVLARLLLDELEGLELVLLKLVSVAVDIAHHSAAG